MLQTLIVKHSVENQFLRSRTTTIQNSLARILKGLESNQNSLIGQDHPRWWQYPVEPPTPIPVNVKYTCDETLGSPSTANCEAVLYEFVQSGDVILDPASGPIIKVTGKSPHTRFNLQGRADFESNRRELRHSCRSKRNAFHNVGYAAKCCRDFDRNVYKQPRLGHSWRYSHQSDDS